MNQSERTQWKKHADGGATAIHLYLTLFIINVKERKTMMEITINWLDAPRYDNAWDIQSALTAACRWMIHFGNDRKLHLIKNMIELNC